MVSRHLKALASDWGFQQDNTHIWGEKHGYLLSLEDGKKCTLMTLTFAPLSDEQRGALYRIMGQTQSFGIDKYALNDTVLSAEFKNGISNHHIIEFWKAFLPILTEKGIQGKSHCVLCGEPIAEDEKANTIRIDQMVGRAHRTCAEKTQQDLHDERERFSGEKKAYLMGAIGALLGGLVCTIPWIFVQHFVRFFASVLGLFIGLGAYKGYKYFGGKIGKNTLPIIVFAIFVSVAFTQFGALTLLMIKNNAPIMLKTYWEILSNTEALGFILRNLVIGYLMAFLGSRKILQTLHDYRDGGSATLIMLD